eukprot:COSAG06_NODE_38389_length_424_cov_0.947692_1_plen_86_part_10
MSMSASIVCVSSNEELAKRGICPLAKSPEIWARGFGPGDLNLVVWGPGRFAHHDPRLHAAPAAHKLRGRAPWLLLALYSVLSSFAG